MTKREAKIAAMNLIGISIDNLKQGEWRFSYPEKEAQKIIDEMDKIEIKFLLAK